MRSIILVLASAIALAGCSMMPFGGSDAEKPTAETAPPATMAIAAADPEVYQIQHTTRGLVRRVKVLLNGRTVDTLNMSKGRTEATSHCCTADGCEKIEAVKACTTFKMICDAKGVCTRADANKASGKL
jgi:hypothetical protein